jgi:sulfur carrier protein ThiS
MVKIRFRDSEQELPHGMAVRDVIHKLGLDPQLILALREGKLINEETLTRDNDVITLVSVISGG